MFFRTYIGTINYLRKYIVTTFLKENTFGQYFSTKYIRTIFFKKIYWDNILLRILAPISNS